ncbi:MAG: hypothetical protein NT020_02460 [Chloroflexales bacterium]|nr:hypothetical protein [Chloroflexales bacterium]
MSALKADAVLNIEAMSLTAATFQSATVWLNAAAVLQSTVAWAIADGAVSASLRVPAEHPGLAVLLDSGMHISDVETFCASAEWFDPRCYAPSGIL